MHRGSKLAWLMIVGLGVVSAGGGCSSQPGEESASTESELVRKVTQPGDDDGTNPPPPTCYLPPPLTSDVCYSSVSQGYAVSNPDGKACPVIDLPAINAKWWPTAVNPEIIAPALGAFCAYPFISLRAPDGSIVSSASRRPNGALVLCGAFPGTPVVHWILPSRDADVPVVATGPQGNAIPSLGGLTPSQVCDEANPTCRTCLPQ
jgi:hypothetical protein